MLKPIEFEPVSNPPLPKAPDDTIVVRVRKEGEQYVADPERTRVRPGRCANIVFVLENAPENAELLKMTIQESNSSSSARSNPFSLPGKMRVMLLTDDNSREANQGRKFDYVLKVREGEREFDVDPGIDNDPPR